MRPTPFDLVFRRSAPEIFPKIRQSLAEARYDPRNRDEFLMLREVLTLVRELRPEEGLGEGIDQLAALLHHSYLFWEAEQPVMAISAGSLVDLLKSAPPEIGLPASAYYAAMPEHRIWAQVIPEHTPEPLDGCFVHSAPTGAALRVLAVFGIHPEREGFSVVESVGTRPPLLMRADGSELFAPTLTGGKAAGLFSLVGEEELLELGWRTAALRAGSEYKDAPSEPALHSSKLQTPGS
jgi:hypothetical protein